MTLKQRLTKRYREYVLQRIRKEASQFRQRNPNSKASQLRIWMLSADRVDRSIHRLKIIIPLIVLTPVILWTGATVMLSQQPSNAQTVPADKAASEIDTVVEHKAANLNTIFRVELPLDPQLEGVTAMLHRVRERQPSIEIEPTESGSLLLIDESPNNRKEAERLQQIYEQLFGVAGEVRQIQ